MMGIVIWPTMILLAFGASASTAKAMKRKPVSEAYEMQVTVVYGERTTEFSVTSSGNDGVLKISQRRIAGKKKLDKSEIELLLQIYAKLPAVSDVPDSCYRTKIEILMVRSGQPQEMKASCFAVESPTEPAFRHFANLLAQPF